MPDEEKDIGQRLADYSTRTNVNAMNIALIEQRMAVAERQLDAYHIRLHKAEDELLVVKTVQQIHDTQIQGVRKILLGNGERETIPMDIERMDRAIDEILKTNWKELQLDMGNVKKWQDKFDQKQGLVWGAIAVLVLNRLWEIFVP